MLSGLKETWALAQSATPSTNVLALTVPEAGIGPAFEASRTALNAAIMSHSAPRYHAFDFGRALPLHSLSKRDRARWWDDDVHLSPEGYRRMGELVGDALVEIMCKK